MIQVLHGDMLAILPTLPACSIDSVVTDPPYELGFMNRKWDGTGVAFDPATWAEAFRVLKPGGHLVAFGGSRTYHRIAVAIEDAGFEIRDSLMWLYGTGFPKSANVSKMIDKSFGAVREVVGVAGRSSTKVVGTVGHVGGEYMETAPATPEAAQWSGWGTALKPAFEPIILARKPLDGTIAANVLKHGVGGLNIDACRVEGGVAEMTGRSGASTPSEVLKGNIGIDSTWEPSQLGRFPANLLHDGSDEVMAAFAAYNVSG